MNSCLECKHYKRSERIGVKCCEFGLDSNYCEKDKEDFAIEELEKIKAEIVELEKKMGQGVFTVELASEIVNDHISELKGENNE